LTLGADIRGVMIKSRMAEIAETGQFDELLETRNRR